MKNSEERIVKMTQDRKLYRKGDDPIDTPELREIKKKLERISELKIIFTKHFLYDSQRRKGVTKDAILHYLYHPEKLRRVDLSREKYKVWFKESRKYNMVMILAFKEEGVYIITAYKTNKKWQMAVILKR